MGTRRLRLYVVAYLRGLLKPYYVQGNLSVVREELILTALSAELDNEAAKQIQLVQASMAQNVKNKSTFYDKLFNKVFDFRQNLEFKKQYTPAAESVETDESGNEIERLTNDPEVNRLIHDMKEMEKSGELDRLNKEMQDLIDEDKKKASNPYLYDSSNEQLVWQEGSTEAERAAKKKKEYNLKHGIIEDE